MRSLIRSSGGTPAPGRRSFSAAASSAPRAVIRPRSWVETDLDALRRNFGRLVARLPEHVDLLVAVKKDAYGHGLVEVARALQNVPRLSGFGVADLDEGLRLRTSGIDGPVLVLSVLHGPELAEAVEHDLTLTITCAEDALEAEDAASEVGSSVRAHLKIDTGMGRLGLPPAEALAVLPDPAQLDHVSVEGVFTHLPNAWIARDEAKEQARLLAAFAEEARKRGLPVSVTHLGGSDAIVLGDDEISPVVRAGIAIYGYHAGVPGLEPVMNFKSTVIYRKRAAAGTRISYQGTHTLYRDSELALVAAGYGNGYPRGLSNVGEVLIRGRRCSVLGLICMDQMVVDVTEIPEVRAGEEVVLFGRQGDAVLGADETAEWGGMIDYELLCSAGRSNPRVMVSTAEETLFSPGDDAERADDPERLFG